MTSPLHMSLALTRATLGMIDGWLRLSETMSASHKVVEHRSGLINDAARSPFEGNYAELGRMIPEKLSAFTMAGSTWIESCFELQRQFMAQTGDASRFMASGGAHPAAFLSRAAERSNRFAVTAMGAGAKALAPVHRTATGNARRLNI